MAKCFLSYSSGYEHLKEPFRRLLEVIGFDSVDVFDGPDFSRVSAIVEQKIQNADAVVVLYGPSRRPQENQESVEGANWPTQEALYAFSIRKPSVLIVHNGTHIPELIADQQTAARFDFWAPQTFLDNVHHIAKFLMDLKRTVDLPPGTQPYLFKKAIMRNRIQDKHTLRVDVFHEVVARQPCSRFHHALDTEDKTPEAHFQMDNFKYEVEGGVLGSDVHRVELRIDETEANRIDYFIEVTPALRQGEVFWYRRSFIVNNRFPLNQAEIAARSAQPGYPRIYGKHFYGDAYDVIYDMDSITAAIHFPRSVRIRNSQVLVVQHKTRQENATEIERCQEMLVLKEDVMNPERILELNVTRPLINHSYYLLYEPEE